MWSLTLFGIWWTSNSSWSCSCVSNTCDLWHYLVFDFPTQLIADLLFQTLVIFDIIWYLNEIMLMYNVYLVSNTCDLWHYLVYEGSNPSTAVFLFQTLVIFDIIWYGFCYAQYHKNGMFQTLVIFDIIWYILKMRKMLIFI